MRKSLTTGRYIRDSTTRYTHSAHTIAPASARGNSTRRSSQSGTPNSQDRTSSHSEAAPTMYRATSHIKLSLTPAWSIH